MVISFFDKFDIDTNLVNEKLDILKKSNTENSLYISNFLLNLLDFLFKDINLNCTNINSGMPSNLGDLVIYYDTVINGKIPLNNLEKNLIVVGNHTSKKVNDNVTLLNIKDTNKLIKCLENYNSISIGINVSSINYSKYYYNKMRSYFLNVLNAINNISIDEIKENTENVATKILLDAKNFTSYYEVDKSKINFKALIKSIAKIKKEFKAFYINENNLNNMEKDMLNEFSLIIELLKIQSKEERISKIYDIFCERMLNEAIILNYCNFEDNKCITMRYENGFPNSKENGCCSNTYLDKGKDCRYLKEDHSCAICAISCRIFTCKYLQNRGIDHSLYQYPLIDCMFNKIKKQKLIFNFFTPKEEMMKKLKSVI